MVSVNPQISHRKYSLHSPFTEKNSHLSVSNPGLTIDEVHFFNKTRFKTPLNSN